ncbi:MAG: HD domain-containing protein [Nitrospirota bacterium]|nr:HD domain-containing protein [Nitrospirota bacterium]
METNNIEHDLSLAVHELSVAYEELSLLYRISEIYASLSVDEICARIIDEAINTISVQTAAVLFLDEKGEKLYTKAYRGAWESKREFPKDDGILWKTIQAKKSCAFCKIKETEYSGYIPMISSLMVCPILGKAKTVGAIAVADKEFGEEFFSKDSKLLMAIATQAGLAIENAFLYSELETLLVGAIRCLVKALEATSYWTAGHTERVTEYAMGIGQTMDLESDLIEKLKICSLLHDIGKIATPKEILNKDEKLSDEEWIEIKKHPIIGAEILVELKQFKDVILGVKYHHEYWDGRSGIFGLKHDEIPIMARILSVADTFDALTSDRPYRRKHTKEEAVREIMRCSGTQFDPAVVEAFLKWVNLQRRVF